MRTMRSLGPRFQAGTTRRLGNPTHHRWPSGHPFERDWLDGARRPVRIPIAAFFWGGDSNQEFQRAGFDTHPVSECDRCTPLYLYEVPNCMELLASCHHHVICYPSYYPLFHVCLLPWAGLEFPPPTPRASGVPTAVALRNWKIPRAAAAVACPSPSGSPRTAQLDVFDGDEQWKGAW